MHINSSHVGDCAIDLYIVGSGVAYLRRVGRDAGGRLLTRVVEVNLVAQFVGFTKQVLNLFIPDVGNYAIIMYK